MGPPANTKDSEVTPRRRVIGSAVDATPPTGASAPDRPTFAQIYDDYFAFVWRSALRLGTPRANIDDIVQEIFIIANDRLPGFEGRSTVKTWLFGIVLNVVRTHRRSLAAKQPHALRPEILADADVLPDPAEGPHERVTKAEAARILDRVLEDVDDEKREVFVLSELEEMSGPAVAEALELNLKTAYARIHAARRAFERALQRHRARQKGGA